MAKGNKFDLDALKASNFVDAARTHVEKAYILLTGEPEESIVGRDLEELRATCQSLNTLDAIRTTAPAPEAPKLAVVGRIPNLGPSGKWEGRMRRVMVIDPNPESEKKTVSVAWEGKPWDFAYGVAVDMPWPYWNALKDAVSRDEASERVTEWVVEKGAKGKVTKVTTPIERPVHNYQDLGDVPGTEDLPESYFDFFRRRARDTNCFRELKIPMLLLIHERLYDGPPMDRKYNNVQLDAITLRLKIAERLGPEFVSQINSEMFEAA